MMKHFKMLIFVSFLALCQAMNKLQEADDVVEYDSVIIDTRVNGEDRRPRSDSACKIYHGRYIAAGDNADQSTSKADLQECANWCAEIPACRAWTFNSDEMRCWLKLSDGEKGCPDGDCEKSPWVSGTKSCGANTDGRLLLLSSDGEAGAKQSTRMGLYSLMEGVTHNKMPVWIRDLKDQKLFYSTGGYWMIGAEPESDSGGVSTVAKGLASPLLGVVSGWEYSDAGWHTDELLSLKAIAFPTYPEEVTVSSNGPAKEEHHDVMGVYTMTWARQHKRPVWQKVQDNSLFLFYTGNGFWTIGDDLTKTSGWIMSGRSGLLHLPEGGWQYSDGTGTWPADPTLTIANTDTTPTTLYATCDDWMRVYLDGVLAHEDRDRDRDTVWKIETEIAIPSGTQVIGIECEDGGGGYGILASTVKGLFTNQAWRCTSTQNLEGWSKPGFTDTNSDFSKPSPGIGNPLVPTKIDDKAKWIWGPAANGWAFCKIRL